MSSLQIKECGGQTGEKLIFSISLMNPESLVNVASVPHRSLFRYPGGKTWLVPQIRSWLASLPWRPVEFVEPFAGGGIVGLTVIFENLADRITLVERDHAVSAVWHVVLGGQGRQLAHRIETFPVTKASVRDVLDSEPPDLLDQAFATIVRNRMQHGGIMAPGASLMKAGENGKGLRSRWYPATLKRRIREISRHREKICFLEGDGLQHLQSVSGRKQVAYLIDPPYTVAGTRLYTHSQIDHDKLFRIASGLQGEFLMTYDNVEPIRDLARQYGFDTRVVAMKNTHHKIKRELLISRNLDWTRHSNDGTRHIAA